MLLSAILFLIGLGLLIVGADWLVGGASSIAKRLRVSDLVVGLTIVAFGTSAPELVVNIIASLQGNTDIAIGNVLGSNIFNVFFILGVAAIIYPLTVQRSTTWNEIPLSLLAALVVGFLAMDQLLGGADASGLSRGDGLVLLGFFGIFMAYVFSIARNGASTTEETKQYGWLRSLGMVLAGLIGLVLGGKWIVDGAVLFATTLGVSESLIGLTIVAAGTSLPELATSAVAAYRKKTDIAVGNVVGSNIFNIFWILGVSAIIRPLPFQPESIRDITMAAAGSLVLFVLIFIRKRGVIERWQGGLLLICFSIYLAYLIQHAA